MMGFIVSYGVLNGSTLVHLKNNFLCTRNQRNGLISSRLSNLSRVERRKLSSIVCSSAHNSDENTSDPHVKPQEDQVACARIASVKYESVDELMNRIHRVVLTDERIIRIALLQKMPPKSQKVQYQKDLQAWQESTLSILYFTDPMSPPQESIADDLLAHDEDSFVVLHPQARKRITSSLSMLGVSSSVPESSRSREEFIQDSRVTLKRLFDSDRAKGNDGNVCVIIAAARAENKTESRSLIKIVRDHVQELESRKEALWSSVLVSADERVIAICAYSSVSSEEHSAVFDTSLADHLIADPGWTVTFFNALFPCTSGWDSPLVLPSENKKSSHNSSESEASRWQTEADTKENVVADDGPLSRKSKMVFGVGALETICDRIIQCDRKRVYIVTGWNQSRADPLVWVLQKACDDGKLEYRFGFGVSSGKYRVHESGLADLERLVNDAREWGADCVIGYGGGTALDAAKMVSLLASKYSSEHETENFVKNVRQALLEQRRTFAEIVLPEQYEPLPLFLFPTMFGSGAEVSDCVILRDRGVSDRIRVAIQNSHSETAVSSSEKKSPRVTLLIDPRLAVRLKASLAALGGLSAACMCIEALIARNRTRMSAALAADGLARAAANIQAAKADATDATAVSELLQAMLYGGLAREVTGFGVAASFVIQLGAHFQFTTAYARILPALLEVAVEEASMESNSEQLGMIQNCARIVTQKEHATSRDLIEWVINTTESLELELLEDPSLTKDLVDDMVHVALNGGGLYPKATPFHTLNEFQLKSILYRAFLLKEAQSPAESVDSESETFGLNPKIFSKSWI